MDKIKIKMNRWYDWFNPAKWVERKSAEVLMNWFLRDEMSGLEFKDKKLECKCEGECRKVKIKKNKMMKPFWTR